MKKLKLLDITCLGMTNNGLVRQERYEAKSNDARRRMAELVATDLWSIELRNIGSRDTTIGRVRCHELTIMGKGEVEKDNGIIGLRNTIEMRPVRMASGPPR